MGWAVLLGHQLEVSELLAAFSNGLLAGLNAGLIVQEYLYYGRGF
jgi:hypothetical protein